MSTNSVISVKHPDGTFAAVSCHYDGYHTGVGATLVHYYRNYERVKRLIQLGNLSTVCPRISPPDGVPHNFEKRHELTTTAYIRDRGEGPQNRARHFRSFDEMDDFFGREHVYVFDACPNAEEGIWTYWDRASRKQHVLPIWLEDRWLDRLDYLSNCDVNYLREDLDEA